MPSCISSFRTRSSVLSVAWVQCPTSPLTPPLTSPWLLPLSYSHTSSSLKTEPESGWRSGGRPSGVRTWVQCPGQWAWERGWKPAVSVLHFRVSGLDHCDMPWLTWLPITNFRNHSIPPPHQIPDLINSAEAVLSSWKLQQFHLRMVSVLHLSSTQPCVTLPRAAVQLCLAIQIFIGFFILGLFQTVPHKCLDTQGFHFQLPVRIFFPQLHTRFILSHYLSPWKSSWMLLRRTAQPHYI